MIVVILSVLALFVLQTLLPASIRYFFSGNAVGQGLMVALGSRDSQPPLSVVGARADRALTNMHEALPVFLALALIFVAKGIESELAVRGAWVFFIARLLYVPAYLSGVFGLRSAVWTVGLVGLGMMVAALVAVV